METKPRQKKNKASRQTNEQKESALLLTSYHSPQSVLYHLLTSDSTYRLAESYQKITFNKFIEMMNLFLLKCNGMYENKRGRNKGTCRTLSRQEKEEIHDPQKKTRTRENEKVCLLNEVENSISFLGSYPHWDEEFLEQESEKV